MTVEFGSIILYSVVTIFIVIIYAFMSVYFAKKYISSKKEEGFKEHAFALILFVSFLLLLIGRIFISIFDYSNNFESTVGLDISELIYFKIGITLQLIALGFLLININRQTLKGKDKYFITVIYFAIVLLAIISNDIFLTTLYIFIALMYAGYIPFGYLYIAKISAGNLRRKGIYIFIGFLIFFFGTALGTEQSVVIIRAVFVDLHRIHIYSAGIFAKYFGLLFMFEGYK